eukprot:10315988-Alexandrium_andersonii.AAC.1
MCWLGHDRGAFKYTSFCDVQHMPPKCGGAEMHAIYLKQLASIGAPSWDKPCAARAALPTGAEHAVTHVR